MDMGLNTPKVIPTQPTLGLGMMPARPPGPDMTDVRATQYQRGTDMRNAGARPDGSAKGRGFLGALKTADGSVATEISIGMEIGGKEVLMPALVPTLSRQEVLHLLKGGQITREIENKAADHAIMRMKQGLSPFAAPDEQPYPLPK